MPVTYVNFIDLALSKLSLFLFCFQTKMYMWQFSGCISEGRFQALLTVTTFQLFIKENSCHLPGNMATLLICPILFTLHW